MPTRGGKRPPSAAGATPSASRPGMKRQAADAAGSAAPAFLRFAELRGHDRPVAFLRDAWRGGRLAHAYFFTGPSGIGKLGAARALALGVHCETVPFEACADCAACRTIAAGTHADVRTIAGPAADRRDISIDQVRDLQRELGYRSLSTRPKIGIVNDAELLTQQAQNALLKTLEEPTGDTVLILIGVNAASLAPTILSRCQRVTFAPLPDDDVAAILERHGRPHDEAVALAAYAEGSPGRALGLDPAFFTTRRRELLRDLAALRGAEFKRIAAFAQELAAEDKDLGPTLTVIASSYRDALRRAVLGADAAVQNADIGARAGDRDVARNLRNLEITYATMTALRQNANRNLALTQMLLQLS